MGDGNLSELERRKKGIKQMERGSSWTFPGDSNPQEDGKGSDSVQGDWMKHYLKGK